MSDLQSIGITKQQEELFVKVKRVVDGNPDLEKDLEANPNNVFIACEHSGFFTESEMSLLKDVFTTKKKKTFIQRIKELLGL